MYWIELNWFESVWWNGMVFHFTYTDTNTQIFSRKLSLLFAKKTNEIN